MQALARIEADGRAEVILLSRGGGAKEDLACFNDERVVRAVSQCKIPIITGIGHQRDESLADLAADLCAHTPTAAAAQAVPDLADLRSQQGDRVEQLRWATARQIQNAQQRLQLLQQRLQRQAPDRQLQRDRQHLNHLNQRLLQATRQRFRQENLRYQSLQERLSSLDPAAVIRRGYALVRQQSGEIVRSAETIAVGDRVQVQLAQGEITVRVEAIGPLDPRSFLPLPRRSIATAPTVPAPPVATAPADAPLTAVPPYPATPKDYGPE